LSGQKKCNRLLARFLWPVSLCLCAAGCTWDQLNPFQPPPPPPGPVDSLVLRPDGLEEARLDSVDTNPDMAGGLQLFRQQEYARAEKTFHRLAEKTKDNAALAEKARFYEAECLYLQDRYPRAADTYIRMLNDFGSGMYREQAVQRLYDIADHWLDDTRQQMLQAKEKREGKRWFVTPQFVQFDRTKPVLDEQGRALEVLEQVRYNAISGPLADKALYLLGKVKFYNKDYLDADHYFTQLVEQFPNSPFAEESIKLAIVSKHLCTGGADYDGRKVAEARDLVHKALHNYPKLAEQKEEFLDQLVNITLQQAEKDYNKAEFYRRTGRPCPAYFLYEVVRRRYPGTPYAEKATEQMHKLRAQVEKENGGALPVPELPPLQPGMPLIQPDAAPQAAPQPAPGELPPPRPLPDLDR
jgi:outer membrane protein assembly factor BamD (BamD/ComL family)